MTSELNALMLAMLKVFLALVTGYTLQKKGVFNPDSNKKLSELIVTITMPCLIVCSAAEENTVARSEMLLLLGAGVIIYAGLIAFAFLCARLFRVPKAHAGTFEALIIFGNAAFMGYPLVEALYGRSAILLATIVNMPFNILAFTLGIALLSGDSAQKLSVRARLRSALNPGLIAGLLALVVVLCAVPLPQVIVEPLGFIGNLTPALSMITLGSILAEFPLAAAFRDKSVWLVSALRLIVIPLVVFWAAGPFFTDRVILGVLLITNAVPCATTTAMLSARYGGEEAYAAGGVLVSTVLSIVTIPVIAALLL